MNFGESRAVEDSLIPHDYAVHYSSLPTPPVRHPRVNDSYDSACLILDVLDYVATVFVTSCWLYNARTPTGSPSIPSLLYRVIIPLTTLPTTLAENLKRPTQITLPSDFLTRSIVTLHDLNATYICDFIQSPTTSHGCATRLYRIPYRSHHLQTEYSALVYGLMDLPPSLTRL
ncbi:hypothetical protein Hypma_003078 [Hypsizygus marmoreus]|uniref:Uncharacterized protein n=1 Tax=Hypsizygus marmoreus TaxID=39966 RepID=A0A369J2T1_HYPMA|nr:hypothetical protein Hypma_003078 [Hypsizygus marmoreus]